MLALGLSFSVLDRRNIPENRLDDCAGVHVGHPLQASKFNKGLHVRFCASRLDNVLSITFDTLHGILYHSYHYVLYMVGSAKI